MTVESTWEVGVSRFLANRIWNVRVPWHILGVCFQLRAVVTAGMNFHLGDLTPQFSKTYVFCALDIIAEQAFEQKKMRGEEFPRADDAGCFRVVAGM
jgi:hypothetical protein